MKTLTKIVIASFVFATLFFTGCKKDSTTDSGTPVTYVAPTWAKDTLIKVPQQMVDKSSSDYNLAMGVYEISFVNAFSTALGSAFYYNESDMKGWASSKNSDGSTTYSWKYLQYTYKLIYYHSASESWWKYAWDSSSYSYTYYYILDKGTSGEIDWYSQSNFKAPQKVVYKDSWSISGSTNSGTFNVYNNDGSVSEQFVSTSNKDKSGTLKVYNQINSTGSPVLQWYYVWDKNGSGSYTSYKSDGTTVDFTGAF